MRIRAHIPAVLTESRRTGMMKRPRRRGNHPGQWIVVSELMSHRDYDKKLKAYQRTEAKLLRAIERALGAAGG